MERTHFAWLLVMWAFFSPIAALAHSSGASIEKNVGGHIVDLGYDPSEVFSGDRLILDFDLKSEKDSTREKFDYVWVRIEKDRRTLIATGVARADVGPTTLLFELPADAFGEFSVHLRFEKGEETLAEAEFPLSVAKSPVRITSSPPFMFVFGIVAGAIAVFIALWLIPRKSTGQ